MSVQSINYDLRRPGQDYPGLFDAIKALGPWWHCLDSCWLIDTSLSSSQVRDTLQNHMDANDCLLVAELKGDWASYGLSRECTDWLRAHLA